jgi:hypothetical protein
MSNHKTRKNNKNNFIGEPDVINTQQKKKQPVEVLSDEDDEQDKKVNTAPCK